MPWQVGLLAPGWGAGLRAATHASRARLTGAAKDPTRRREIWGPVPVTLGKPLEPSELVPHFSNKRGFY